MTRPAVSVLLPCRNAEEHLPDCVRGLREQTLGGFEVVAVDDGSRDGTAGILEAWAGSDERVRVLGVGEAARGRAAPGGSSPAEGAGGAPGAGPGRGNGGAPSPRPDGGDRARSLVRALRRAAAAARGPLLARMDADDVAHPGRLERQARLLSDRPDLAACGTGVRYFPEEELGPGYRRYERWINGLREPSEIRRALFVECPVAHPTLMVRRSVYRALGGYRAEGWPEDYDLILRLHLAGMRAANLGEGLLRWRLRPDSLSRRSPAYARDAFRRCKAHFLARGFLPADRPTVVWGAGSAGKGIARALGEEDRGVDGFVDLDPRKIGQRIHGAPVWSPEAFFDRFERGPRPYVLAAVGAPGARREIREALTRRGWREIGDFRAVA